MRFVNDVKWRAEKFGAVVFNTLTEKIFVTNETGKDVLRLLEKGLDVPAIVSALKETYEDRAGGLEADVVTFVADLSKAGLLEQAEGGTA